MTLATPADLRKIMEVPDAVTDPQLQAFIDAADLIVTEDVAPKGPTLSAARLKQIEIYVAAHFALQLTERGGLTSSRIERSIDTYTNLSPLGNAIGGFELTRYGQQALLLDTTGVLNALSKSGLKAQFRVISRSATPDPCRTG